MHVQMLCKTGDDVVGTSRRACDMTDDVVVGVSMLRQTRETTREIACLSCCRGRARKTVRGVVGLRHMRRQTRETACDVVNTARRTGKVTGDVAGNPRMRCCRCQVSLDVVGTAHRATQTSLSFGVPPNCSRALQAGRSSIEHRRHGFVQRWEPTSLPAAPPPLPRPSAQAITGSKLRC